MPGLSNYGAGSQLNTGSDPKHRPVPIAPIEEEFAGYNNPYRGMEQHGVAHTVEAHDIPIDDDSVREYEREEITPEPIPVKIVTQGGREFKQWNVRREFATAGGGSNRILGQDESRTKAYVKNIGTQPIYISPDPIANSQLGYQLSVGQEFVYDQQGDMWAMTDDVSAQALAILIEYTVKK